MAIKKIELYDPPSRPAATNCERNANSRDALVVLDEVAGEMLALLQVCKAEMSDQQLCVRAGSTNNLLLSLRCLEKQ